MRKALVRGFAAFGIVSLLLLGCATTPVETPKVPTATTGGACNPQVGSKAPDLVIDGKPAIARGKVTIVDLWATWCKPCAKSFPKYQELYTKYRAQGLEIVAVSEDEPNERDKITPFVTEKGAKFTIGWDGGQNVAACWKPPNMPTSYLIDKKGVVREIHNKWEDGDEKALEKQIKSLL
jgi:cytochrome c biogenesis protein CcmG, thiol:disulfide interchange protein DsbE